MSKIDLDPITSGYSLSKINANFQKVEDELNNKVLYRNSPTGEPNSMSSNLDMNSRSILNASKISSKALELDGVQVVPTNLAIDPYNGTREALRRSYAEAGYNLVDGSFEVGGTLVNANDVLLQESTGKAFSGPTGTVAAGTNPTSGGFVDRRGELLRLQLLSSVARHDSGRFVLRDILSVKDFAGVVGDGIHDDTVGIQAAIDYAQASHAPLYFPASTYKVTATLNVYEGSQLYGDTKFQYNKGFGVAPKATTILFQPTLANSDLFKFGARYSTDPFIFHVSLGGFYIESTSPNTRYAIAVNEVIYGKFFDMGFFGPMRASVLCNGTINNRFENMYTKGDYACVVYEGGIPTTDVWEQCSFQQSPIGVRFEGEAVGVRFKSCLWEQIDYYGLDVHSKCQNITVSDGYGEDVPFNTDPSSCMFRVGMHTGSSPTDFSNHLTVTGGVYNGRNAGASGQLFYVGSCASITVNGISASRWPLLFFTSADTRPRSIFVNNMPGISWSALTNDLTKLSGLLPNNVINGGSYGNNLYALSCNAENIKATVLENSQVKTNGAWYPETDGVAALGLSNQRWGTVYAATGAIYTSDMNEKQDIRGIEEVEKRVAMKLKSGIKCFKFKDSVALKAEDARNHFGVMAQYVAEAFAEEGLDASAYGLFCSDTWYTVDGVPVEPGIEIPQGAIAHTRLGVRYDELAMFILSAI